MCQQPTNIQREKDPIGDWGDRMIDLNTRYGIKILGGCCGTDAGHLEYIVSHIPTDPNEDHVPEWTEHPL